MNLFVGCLRHNPEIHPPSKHTRLLPVRMSIAASELQITVNGSRHAIPGEPDRPLLTVLRDEIGLTGAKYGCGEAQCGACVVLIDGQPAPSCITPVREVAGCEIRTIESLEKNGQLHP